jgi:CheY-like chemotaxis protein
MDHTRPTTHVLVVDDTPDVVDSTVTLLALHGFKATGALGGRHAVESATADPPDVVLVDLLMPGMDGFEVAQALRELGRPPVMVAMTGLRSEWVRRRAHESGFAFHLVKPVPPEELVAVVHECGRFRGEP